MDRHRGKGSLRHYSRYGTNHLLQLVDENIFEWIVSIIVLNPDSQYYGGYFKAKMTFPRDYPYSPPGKCHVGHREKHADKS